MKISVVKSTKPLIWTACVCGLFCIGAKFQAQAQTSIYTASYGGTNNTGGGAVQTTGTYTLNTFTVENVYTAGSATNESVFITDGTANGIIFGTQTALASLTPGVTATATVTDSTYHNEEEFKTPTAITVVSTGAYSTPTAMLSQVAATVGSSATANPFTVGPSDSLYASEGALLFAPITFTITPNASGTLSTTTTTTLTDTATGDVVSLYKSAVATAFTAGTTYTVTGVETPFPVGGVTESEIVNVSSLTPAAVPEPSSYAMMVLGFAGLLLAYQRRGVGSKLR